MPILVENGSHQNSWLAGFRRAAEAGLQAPPVDGPASLPAGQTEPNRASKASAGLSLLRKASLAPMPEPQAIPPVPGTTEGSTDPLSANDAQTAAPVALDAVPDSSEARREGKECVSTCRSRWSPTNKTKNKIQTK